MAITEISQINDTPHHNKNLLFTCGSRKRALLGKLLQPLVDVALCFFFGLVPRAANELERALPITGGDSTSPRRPVVMVGVPGVGEWLFHLMDSVVGNSR